MHGKVGLKHFLVMYAKLASASLYYYLCICIFICLFFKFNIIWGLIYNNAIR